MKTSTIVALVIPLLTACSFSAPITVTFSGAISSHFSGTWTESGFAVGQSFNGEYTFEPTTPGNPFATNFGGIPPERMPYPDSLLSFSVTSGGNTLTSSGAIQNGILIDNNLTSRDNYFVILTSLESELYIDLRSSNLGLFTSQALPSTIPAVSDFDQSAFFRVRVIGGGYAQGNLDSIAVVPEPSTLLLLAGGLLAFGRRCRTSKLTGA